VNGSFRRAACLAGLLAAAPALGDGAPLWTVAGPAGTVWLLGSVHVLRPQDYPLPAEVQRAYAGAERIVMELDLDELDFVALQAEMLRMGMPGEGPSARELLGPEAWSEVVEQAAAAGFDLEPLGTAEAWLVALTLYNLALARAGFDPGLGVEKYLAERALRDGIEVSGLETPQEQLALFDGLPPDAQRALLGKAVDELDEAAAEADALIAAWRSGEPDRLAAWFESDYADFEALLKPLVGDRNRRWLPAVEALLQSPGDSLVVVGALHLVGEDGLPALLEEKGYRVEGP
jgi:uncharacterized protein YbaP (TraB family)